MLYVIYLYVQHYILKLICISLVVLQKMLYPFDMQPFIFFQSDQQQQQQQHQQLLKHLSLFKD